MAKSSHTPDCRAKASQECPDGSSCLFLAEKYNIDIMTMTGFLDGINDSLKTPNPIEEMDEDTQVSLAFEKELKRIGCTLCLSGILS